MTLNDKEIEFLKLQLQVMENEVLQSREIMKEVLENTTTINARLMVVEGQ